MKKTCLMVVAAVGSAAVATPGNVALREVVRGPDALAVSITTNAAGHAVLDFGKHQFGWLEVDVKKPGPYKIVWGELLDEKGSVQTGRRYTRSEGRIRCATTEGVFDGVGTQRIPYTTGNGNAYFMGNRITRDYMVKKELPKFGVVMPFRWAEIVELPFPVAADTVRQVPIYYPYDMAESRFDCDSEALNRVYGFCKHSIRATTFTGLFIDGDRERWPYEADSYITQLSTYAMTSDYSLARKTVEHLSNNSTWPTEWKQFFIRMCHADWMYTGRPDRIAAHYEAMKTQKLWLNLAREDGLLVTGTKEAQAKGARDIVDWARCYRDGFEFRPVNAVVNALHYRNLVEMSEMAAAIGKQDDARAFAERARKVRASFIKAFVDPASGLVRDGEGSKHLTVHANAMAIACGVLSGREASAPADFIVKKGMRCSTYMSQFVLEALFMAGRSDEAFRLMTTDGPRGWMQMMKLGATVSMEFWDLTLKEGGRVPDMNHAWSTAPINITVRHLLGVTPLKPGFEEIRFAPQFGPLARLSAAVPTARGAFTVEARREGGRWTVDFVTPAPVKVVSDGSERSLPAGSHRVYFAVTTHEGAEIDFAKIPDVRIFKGNDTVGYRDPAAWYEDGVFHIFITMCDPSVPRMTIGHSTSRNLVDWSPVEPILPMDKRFNWSSPGNVVKVGDERVLCFQKYPTPDATPTKVAFADDTARLYTIRTKDFKTWTAPELIMVKGPNVSEAELGRMIDPYLVKGTDGLWWCFYKQQQDKSGKFSRSGRMGVPFSVSEDLKVWKQRGFTDGGENVCVLPDDKTGGWLMLHSPNNGIGFKRSDDLVHWTDCGKTVLGQKDWPWAKGRITAATVIDCRATPGIGKYVMFFHGSGPRKEIEGDCYKNCSIGIAWSDDLKEWSWPGKATE